MEGIPRLPMINFFLKTTSNIIDFAPPLKDHIRNFYHEDPESYNKEINEFSLLRQSINSLSIDFVGCSLLKKYFGQLSFLQSRFPMSLGDPAAIAFTWDDILKNKPLSVVDIRYEQASILYNIAVLHSILGSVDNRSTPDGMKISCTHFQCAASAFQLLKDSFNSFDCLDFNKEVLSFKINLMLAQAQECILEKSMLDNRKSSITAKISKQIHNYYNLSIKFFDSSNILSSAGGKKFKNWYKKLELKSIVYDCIALYHVAAQSEESQKFGEQLAYLTAAVSRIDEVTKILEKLDDQSYEESFKFLNDIIKGKYNSSKKDNDFIYHEKVPSFESLPEIKGASLVKCIPLNLEDPEITGLDIFKKLVPLKAHQSSSIYSEEKAKLLRKITSEVEAKDEELSKYMSSLQINLTNILPIDDPIPEKLLERCASISVKPTAIKDLSDTMQSLSHLSLDVECNLKELKQMLDFHDKREKELLDAHIGNRTLGNEYDELKEIKEEYRKCEEALSKATVANEELHKLMLKHSTNLKILASPLPQLQESLPSVEIKREESDEVIINEMRRLLDKVDEMKNQRLSLMQQLREQVHKDDITHVLAVANENQDQSELFSKHLEKHNKFIGVISQNLAAQSNILSALTQANAKYAHIRKNNMEIASKRQAMIEDLIKSYDVYSELLKKVQMGVEHFSKLLSITSPLVQRTTKICLKMEQDRENIIKKSNHQGIEKPLSIPSAVNQQSIPQDKFSYNLPTMNKPLYQYDQLPLEAYQSLPPQRFRGEAPKLKDFLPFMKPNTFGSKVSTGSDTHMHTLPNDSKAGGQYDINNRIGLDIKPDYTVDYSTIASYPSNYVQYNASINKPPDTNYILQAKDSYIDTYNSGNQFQVGMNLRKTPLASSLPNSALSSPIHLPKTVTSYTASPKIASLEHNIPSQFPPSQFVTCSSTLYYDPKFSYSNIGDSQFGKLFNSVTYSNGYNSFNNQASVGYPTMPYDPNQGVGSYAQSYNQNFVNNNQTTGQFNLQKTNDIATSISNPITSQFYNKPNQSIQPQPNYNHPQNNLENTSLQSSYIPSFQIQSLQDNYNNIYFNTIDRNNVQKNNDFNQSNHSTFNPAAIPNNNQQDSMMQQIGTNYQNISVNQPVITQDYQMQQNVLNTSSNRYNQTQSSNFNQTNFKENFNQGFLNSSTQSQYYSNTPNIAKDNYSNSLQNYGPQYLNTNNQLNYSNIINPSTSSQEALYSTNKPNFDVLNNVPHSYNPNILEKYPQYNSNISIHEQSNNQYLNEKAYNVTNNQQLNGQILSQQVYNPNTIQFNTSVDSQQSNFNVNVTQTLNNNQDLKLIPGSNLQKDNLYPNMNTSTNIPINLVGNSLQNSNLINTQNNGNIVQNDNHKNTLPVNSQITHNNSSSILHETTNFNDSIKHTRNSSLSSIASLDEMLSNVDINEDKFLNSLLQPKIVTDEDMRRQKEEEIKNKIKLNSAKDPYLDSESLAKFVSDVEKLRKNVENFCKINLNNTSTLEKEWKEMNEEQEKFSRGKPMAIARCYPLKNKYPDIMPYDSTRVILTGAADDYINASHIRGLSHGCPEFIATQAPIVATVADFWQLIFDSGAEIVVMLCGDEAEKNHIYFPMEKGHIMDHGPFSLSLQSIKRQKNWNQRVVSLIHKQTNQNRTVIHFQFFGWLPEREPNSPVTLLELIREIHSYYLQQRSLMKPVVVHCSNGVGRTGVFCLVYAGIVEMNTGCGIIDVVEMVGLMRQQRKYIIQYERQLKFAYESLLMHAQEILKKKGILSTKLQIHDKPHNNYTTSRQNSLIGQSIDDKSTNEVSHHYESSLPSPGKQPNQPNNILPHDFEGNELEINASQKCNVKPSAASTIITMSNFLPITTNIATVTDKSIISLTDLQNPEKFSIDAASTKKKITKANFGKSGGQLTESNDPSDPLSQLDPLWTMKK